MSKTNWKGFERFIANALGVERFSKTALGTKVPDVLKELGDHTLVIECRNRTNIVIEKSMVDAESHRMSEKDIVTLCYRKTNSKKVDVYMEMKDFKKLYKWLNKLIRVEKNYLQLQNMVVRLDWNDFLWMVKLGTHIINKRDK